MTTVNNTTVIKRADTGEEYVAIDGFPTPDPDNINWKLVPAKLWEKERIYHDIDSDFWDDHCFYLTTREILANGFVTPTLN